MEAKPKINKEGRKKKPPLTTRKVKATGPVSPLGSKLEVIRAFIDPRERERALVHAPLAPRLLPSLSILHVFGSIQKFSSTRPQ